MSKLIALALAASTALTLVAAPQAAADVERVKEGSCSGAATWSLEVEKEEGRIEADFDVNSPSGAGVPWRVRMWDNGTRFFNQLRFTNRFGNFEAEGNTFDRGGTADRITAQAVNENTGQVCRGSLSI